MSDLARWPRLGPAAAGCLGVLALALPACADGTIDLLEEPRATPITDAAPVLTCMPAPAMPAPPVKMPMGPAMPAGPAARDCGDAGPCKMAAAEACPDTAPCPMATCADDSSSDASLASLEGGAAVTP